MSKEEPPIPKSQATEDLEKKLEEVKKGVREMTEKDGEEDKKMLAISLKMGLTDKELLDAGFTQEQIDSARTPVTPENTKEITEPKVDESIDEKVGGKLKEKNASEEILFQKLLQRARERLDDEYALAKLIVERNMLRREEEVQATRNELDVVLEKKEPVEDKRHARADEYLERKETPTSKKYEELRETFEKIKPWQIWKIGKFLKARFQFGPVQRKLMREMEQEEFNKKTSSMTKEEIKDEHKKIKELNKNIPIMKFSRWKEIFKNSREIKSLEKKYDELKRGEVENTTE